MLKASKVFLCAVLLLIAICCALPSLCEEARDINNKCAFTYSINRQDKSHILDHKNMTLWNAEKKGWLEIRTPEDDPAWGIYIRWANTYISDCAIEIKDENGKWVEYKNLSDRKYYNQYVAFDEGLTHFRLHNLRNDRNMVITDIQVLSSGELPSWVQVWQPQEEKTDILIIVAHPDDELLWMGGIIPYYCGELGKKVTVCYVAKMPGYRQNELLDGLWECGVRAYPEMPTTKFEDDYFSTKAKCLKKWGSKALCEYLTGVIRKYKPEIVVTHDENGEYGHGAHKAVCAITEEIFSRLGDESYYRASAKTYGAWQPKKLYIHLYQGSALGQIDFDWRQPLEAFGGRTAFDVAAAAFEYHKSQDREKYVVRDEGPYDNSLFGLYYSSVGPDYGMNDLFEHLTDNN